MLFEIFVCIFSYDIWFYVTHLGLHNKNFYIIHKIHHSTQYSILNFTDAHKAHFIENAIQNSGVLIPLMFININSYYLLTSYIIIIIRSLMRHDYRCSYLFGNHHLLHHKYLNCNYGEYYIDVLCGTKCIHEKDYIYGQLYT